MECFQQRINQYHKHFQRGLIMSRVTETEKQNLQNRICFVLLKALFRGFQALLCLH
jgi:hypothetical protein